jgi:raffinose/stachyose/melibiose transport system substrate-binding protein
VKLTTKSAWRFGAAAAAVVAGLTAAQAGTIKIESRRNDDADIWNSQIIPAFNKQYPDIIVEFSPTAPKEYNAALSAGLAVGTAGDLVTCRPFDASLDLYNKKQLVDLKGMENFSDVAKSAWSADEGKTSFCVPMASIIHGFI